MAEAENWLLKFVGNPEDLEPTLKCLGDRNRMMSLEREDLE